MQQFDSCDKKPLKKIQKLNTEVTCKKIKYLYYKCPFTSKYRIKSKALLSKSC